MPPADLRGWADALVARLPGEPPCAPSGEPPAVEGWDVRATRSGAFLLFRGDVVLKVHRAGTPAGTLAERVQLLAPPVATLWAALLIPEPVQVPPEILPGRRVATLWGRLRPLDPDATVQPWTQAAELLARLHAVRPVPDDLTQPPPHGGPARLHRAVRRLGTMPGSPVSAVVLRAGRAVLAAVDGARRDTPPTNLVHGDWHLGQVGYTGPHGKHGTLRLMDPDDLGAGDPAWDLARPAGFWAAGLLPDDDWQAFLAAYRAAGGDAVPPRGDPWPVLDLPAKAAVVVAAAASLRLDTADADTARDTAGTDAAGADPAGDNTAGDDTAGDDAARDDSTLALIEACARIADAG